MSIKKRNLVDVGAMNHRVEFQAMSGVSDGAGGFVDSWVTLLEAWAAIDDNSGVIYGNVNDHTQTIHDLKFTIRYRDSIYKKPVTDMRLVFRDRPYTIKNIRNINQTNVYLEIVCDGNDWQGV